MLALAAEGGRNPRHIPLFTILQNQMVSWIREHTHRLTTTVFFYLCVRWQSSPFCYSLLFKVQTRRFLRHIEEVSQMCRAARHMGPPTPLGSPCAVACGHPGQPPVALPRDPRLRLRSLRGVWQAARHGSRDF